VQHYPLPIKALPVNSRHFSLTEAGLYRGEFCLIAANSAKQNRTDALGAPATKLAFIGETLPFSARFAEYPRAPLQQAAAEAQGKNGLKLLDTDA